MRGLGNQSGNPRDLLYKIFGGNFVERWLEWNGFADALREWRAARSASSVAKDR
ncbi:MAG: hypothetical protein V3U39_12490 [Acidimicrobiia bacterium]